MRLRIGRFGLGILLTAALLAVGCGEDSRPGLFDVQLDVQGPLAAQNRAVYLDRTFEQLVAVTPTVESDGIRYTVDRIPVGAEPIEMVLTDDQGLVLTINAGDQTLSIVDVETLVEYRFDLPSDYDALQTSPDGRFVVAYYGDPENGGAGDGVFINANEITVFDLAADGGQRLGQVDFKVLTLRSSPLGFDFAPSFVIDGMVHDLLVVRAESALTLIDMSATDPDDVQRRLFFVPEGSTRTLFPQRVIFTEDDPTDEYDVKMFVLTSNSQDIFEVSILPPGAESNQLLALSINQFPGGASPVEMLSYIDLRGDQKLLVLNGGSQELAVIDIATGDSTRIELSWNVSQALRFDLPNEETGIIESWALLYSPGRPNVLFVELDSLEARGIRAVSSLNLSRPVDSIGMLPGAGTEKAVVIHTGALALSVLDLRRRFDIPLPGTATLRNVAFSPAGDRVFTTVAERSVLATIELENGHPSQVDLPEPGGRIAVLSNPQVIVVDHDANEGRLTLLNGVDVAAETGTTIHGLFLENAFEHARSLEEEGDR
jgi:hypothetical protein